MESEPSKDNQSSDEASASNVIESLEVVEQKPLVSDAIIPAQNTKHRRHLNITKRQMLQGLVAVVLVAGVITGLIFLNKLSKKTPATVVVNTQSLDNGTLNQLQPKPGGTTGQQLAISPDTIFKNDIVVQGSVDTAGNLIVGGKVDIQGATSISDSLVVGKSLSVGTNLTVNGQVSAASLNVGSITISSINISGDLVYGGHLIPSGSQPSARTSIAAAGGTVTISGNDTAGTITITTGNGLLLPGEMAVITFNKAFSGTPKVQLTPTSAAASDLRYFVTHSAGFFTINTTSTPAANLIYSFDYLVTQ